MAGLKAREKRDDMLDSVCFGSGHCILIFVLIEGVAKFLVDMSRVGK